ncbi:two-component system nitrogen regulation sensor histidine kinase GlnL [Endobacter medicaginis]|uniref:histidine kinase n=2 Tax=Endobacter medicaginis TaxID=1181271 RepID=A0A839V732_9PROT|nr:two-component system nitrogen regulation sensor histidine kinase GlnL [Endobacter medicaginis]
MSPIGNRAPDPLPPVPSASAMLDNVPLPILLVGADGFIRYANAAAEPFFGQSKGQLLHLDLRELVPADHPLFQLIAQVRASAMVVVEHELSIDTPRLNKQGITVQGTLVNDDSDAIMLTFHDSSAARALDRQLTFKSAARSVSGMAAILAHEVKNPLSGIRGAAQLLEGTVAADDRELAVLIRDEVDRIRKLVERVEVFNEEPVERRGENIHRILEHVRILAQNGFAQGIRFVELYDPSLPPVFGNRDQLIQVLINLVKNAAEAIHQAAHQGSDPGRPGEIVLSTSYQHGFRVALPGSQRRMHLPLQVVVRDNGPGIPEAIRPHLFEPFLTTKASGTGLGLALVAKIVADHGGLIEVDSREGRTEVRLHLPIHLEEQVPVGTAGRPGTKTAGIRPAARMRGNRS